MEKVDAQLALKNVDYDDLLELRKGIGEVAKGTVEELCHPVLDNPRFGSGLKVDQVKSIEIVDPITGKKDIFEFPDTPKSHGFNDIMDNYSKGFPLVSGDGVSRTLYQIEGTYNGKQGIFEWIVDPIKGVTHRRFIRDVVVTGLPNAR